jgi:hypothetical protein
MSVLPLVIAQPEPLSGRPREVGVSVQAALASASGKTLTEEI